ncbi:MAG: F0F1 ATP synthase subunit gamma [Pseudomonadota bacterium]
MARRHEIEEHLRSLKDIDDIMNAMKSLSLMETRKLSHFLSSQKRVVESIRAAAEDFIRAYPKFNVPPDAACSVLILLGAERGFCGGFNEKLAETLRIWLKITSRNSDVARM